MPLARATRGLRSRTGSPPTVDRAAVGAVGAEQQAGRLGATGAEQAGHADHLAAAQLEIERGDARLASEPGGPQERRRRPSVSVASLHLVLERLEHGELAADHLRDELEPRQLRREVFADEAAVAQHGDAVGDAVHLIEEVGDEQHRDARGPHPLDDLEQLVDLAGVEARGRLVEDQHLGVDLHRAGDRHELLHGDRVRLERRRRVDVEVQLLEHLGGAPAHLRPVDPAEATRLAAEHRVLGDREVGREVDLLVHGADSGRLRLRRAVDLERLAAEEDLAGDRCGGRR